MNFVIGFLVGAVCGGIFALLFTPESGAELRAQIQEKTAATAEQLQSEYEKTRLWAEEQTSKLRQDEQTGSALEAE